MNKPTKDCFDVSIKILECNNLLTKINDVSTQVCVQVGDEKRYSKVVQGTTKPFFDDYFVFTKNTNLFNLMDTLIIISALRVRRGCKIRKLIGCISLDVATVWNQPSRQLKKWFTLSLPSDQSVQKKAFIECDLKVTANRNYFEFLQFLSFESREMIGTRRARYKVSIYHCTGLQEWMGKRGAKISIRILYAGRSGRTRRLNFQESLVWNQQIVFVEVYPPTRQRMTLEVLVGSKVLASKSFYLVDFFKIFQAGFLNMFGPTYVHLYGERNLYIGSLLVSLENEVLGQLRELEQIHSVNLKQIEPISQIKYGINKNFVCFGIIFDLMITKANCGKDDVYFSLEMGITKNVSSKRFSVISSNKFLYVPFDEQKPCLSLMCEWPDCTHRLYNFNLLAYLTDDLREKLDLSYILTSKGCEDEAKTMLYSAYKVFKKKCKKVLQLLSKGITELDAKRTAFVKKNIGILASMLIRGINLDSVVKLCKFFVSVLDSCYEDVQDSLPSLTITLNDKGTTIGSCSLHPRYLIFSDIEEKRGKNSAKINNLILSGEGEEKVARMDVWLWLGKREQIDKCKEQIPPGYEPYSLPEVTIHKLPLPSSLTYTSNHTYTAVCHIHSGYIDKEVIIEGECDSFVKVCFFNYCKQTITAKRTLAPTWNETLILSDIILYSSPNYFVENPPMFTLQLWNAITTPPTMIGFTLISSTVKLEPLTSRIEFTPQWWNLGHRCEVLASCEVYKMTSGTDIGEAFSMRRYSSIIPRQLEQPTISYRLEVVFWGMRPSYARTLRNIIQPQITIQISTATLSSDVIARANNTFNFSHETQIINLKLPLNRIYSPPLILKIMSSVKYLTSILEKNVYRYEYQLPKKSQWEALNARLASDRGPSSAGHSLNPVTFPDLIPQAEVSRQHSLSLRAIRAIPSQFKGILTDISGFSRLLMTAAIDDDEYSEESSDEDELEQDWWDRYWTNQIKIYDNTLENQEEFSGFTDVLSTFPVKQRKDNAEDKAEIGKLKAIISLYEWPVEEPVVTMQGQDPEMGVLKLSEPRSRVTLLVRVYCVKATDLYPSDLNGKSDPYIEIATQTKTVSDKLNKILCELNPVFGNFLEVIATLPTDSSLAVRVMDWDALSKDDVIGETIIDIENRFYSKHRATCGLPQTYSTVGPNAWRDIETPMEILERLCNAHNLPLPQYHDKSVRIGSKEFEISRTSLDLEENQERLALAVLNNWEEMPIVGCHLVNEHVEIRSLFREDHPGLIRGKLAMWVDMFDMSLGNIPLPIDIAPRLPQAFELRVNILNTAKIPPGDKTSTDIVITGWLGDPKQVQKTDVHYKSYTGAGNFNWRFVFPFLYYRKENKMVFYQKNLFDIGKTELKLPAVLHLQVYDSEGLLEDSFIGDMTLELCRMPRGAYSLRACNHEKILDPSNCVDLFKVESLKGWWPFIITGETVKVNRGYLEAEFFLITAEEAYKCPVGLGRSPPDPLPAPARIRSRRNPLQCFQDRIASCNCQSCFGLTLQSLVILSLILLVGILIYIIPSTWNKLKPWLNE